MPKQTFFNLPEKKQSVIISAARQEFSRVPFNEAAISNIIKVAEIPRGSFYQYFEDKNDLYLFVLSSVRKEILEKLLIYLKETKGDPIEAFIKLFHYVKETVSKPENEKFFKNTFLDINEKMKNCVAPHNCHPPFTQEFEEVIDKIDFSKLYIGSEKEKTYLLRMLKGIFFQSIMHYLNGFVLEEECCAMYVFQMRLIQKGVYKMKV